MFPRFNEPQFWGWFHLAFFGLYIPLMAARKGQRPVAPGAPLPPRLQHLRATAISLVILAAVSLLIARMEWIELFPKRWPPFTAMLAGVGCYALAVACMWPRWRKAVKERQRVVHLFMPQTPQERCWWVAVSLLAGVGEEITWRGVQFALLGGLTGNAAVASLLAAFSFSVAHAIQGRRTIAVVMLFALGFHLLVWLASSLYVAMAVHAAYDLTAGPAYGRLGKELGYSPDEPKTA